jgi:hypothetical protein
MAPPTGGREGPLAELLAGLRRPQPDLTGEVRDLRAELVRVSERLAAIEALVEQLVPPAAARRVEPAEAAREATVAVGPFTTIEAVRAFQRRVQALPGVREAAVRGYEGAARAIIDIRLDPDH